MTYGLKMVGTQEMFIDMMAIYYTNYKSQRLQLERSIFLKTPTIKIPIRFIAFMTTVKEMFGLAQQP